MPPSAPSTSGFTANLVWNGSETIETVTVPAMPDGVTQWLVQCRFVIDGTPTTWKSESVPSSYSWPTSAGPSTFSGSYFIGSNYDNVMSSNYGQMYDYNRSCHGHDGALSGGQTVQLEFRAAAQSQFGVSPWSASFYTPTLTVP